MSLLEISQSQELPTAYLEQIFIKLKAAKLVESTRGAMGGYLLARSPSRIRISDIIYAVEKPTRTTRCDVKTEKGCHSNGMRCITHVLWEELGHVIHAYFSGISLQDVITGNIKESLSSSPFTREVFHVL